MATASLNINKECIVRDRPCGRIFNCSNTCFVACASSEQVALEIDIIKAILLDEEIEPYISVDSFVPAKDIFCTKICTKIIESKFCIVLLSGACDSHGTVISNPNVYYEYGLMTAWDKNIIPVQREDQELAFNIQSLDTMKYSPGNFKTKLSHSVRLALTSTKMREVDEKVNDLEYYITSYFELKGLRPLKKKHSWLGAETQFSCFNDYNYSRIIYHSEEIGRARIEAKVIARRIERYAADLDSRITGIKKSIEKGNTDAQIEGTTRQLVKTEHLKKRAMSPKFTIVVFDADFREEAERSLDISEIIPNSEIKIISYDEMISEIEEM